MVRPATLNDCRVLAELAAIKALLTEKGLTIDDVKKIIK